MSGKLSKCEMCEEMHVCHDGYCKKCLEQLGKILAISYVMAQAFTLFCPWIIGINEMRKYCATRDT